jgi:DNA (cytosine-5)-methyltransferase 1
MGGGELMQPGRIVDLFAGAGGWDEGLRELGYSALGIEVDRWACATARAAGHERVEADIAALEPEAFAPVWGLIGSPPCQAYSTAGKGLGRFDKPHVIACAHEIAAGHDSRADHLAACRDPRSMLTVEPLRWAVALRPRWIALEQVPSVLELWSLFAGLLAGHGYDATAGVLSAERYGVPQTRKRAYLVASLDGPAELPAPTHRSYNPRRPDHVREEERDLQPWVSMADALGWARDAITYTNNQTASGRRPQGLARPATCPARTIDTASGSWTIERDAAKEGEADG